MVRLKSNTQEVHTAQVWAFVLYLKDMRRLSSDEIQELQRLYKEEGWTVQSIAYLFDIHRSSVDWWVKDIVRNKPVAQKPKYLYTYDEYLNAEMRRMQHKRETCEHPEQKLVVICLSCKEHLEETKKHPALVRIHKV